MEFSSAFRSLHGANYLARLSKGFDHLLALLASSDSEVTLFEKVIQSIGLVHVFQELSLHLVLGKSERLH